MARLVSDATPQVVQAPWWPETMTVTLKGAASGFELASIKDAAMLIHRGNQGELGMEATTHRAALKKLEIGVLEWTRTGAPEKPSRDELAALDEPDADYILGELTRVWAEWNAQRPAGTPRPRLAQPAPQQDETAQLPGAPSQETTPVVVAQAPVEPEQALPGRAPSRRARKREG